MTLRRMALRLQRPVRTRRDPLHAEDRFQFWVTVGFVVIIALVVLILVAAVGIDYYNSHIKPIATVGGASIDRGRWDERTRLTLFRLSRAEGLVREQMAAGLLDPQVGATRLDQLNQAATNAAQASIDELIDLTFEGQLAAERGISATEEEVDAAIEREATIPERRRLQVIFVEPGAERGGQPATGDPSTEEIQAAREKAEMAAAELADGFPFAQVAQGYSTDPSGDNGGEYGIITGDDASEDPWLTQVFELAVNETTEVVEGSDGIYRIGRVTQILPAEPQPAFLDRVTQAVGRDAYRDAIRREVVSDELRDSVTAELAADAAEQLHLAEIVIEQSENEDEASGEGVIMASHILYSPNDMPNAAAAIPEDDPAWAAALAAAQATVDRLRGVVDVDERIAAFEAAAVAESDDPGSGAQGGDLGFFSRDGQYVPELTNPLFDDPELVRGDIVGPLKTSFGHHVVLFMERRAPTEQRIASVVERLSVPDADFAAIARESSDGAEAAEGGDLGWLVIQELPEGSEEIIAALPPGGVSEPVALADGTHFYKLLERAERPLEPDQQALVRQSAYPDWFAQRKTEATSDGRITLDPSILAPSTTDETTDQETLP